MNNLFLMTHIGLGDAIIQNGLIRELALQHDKILLTCYSHNVPSITAMFSDLPNLTLCPIIDENSIRDFEKLFQNKEGYKILRLGVYSGEAHVAPETFDQTFYRQAGVEFSKRWDAFKAPVIEPCVWPYEYKLESQYALICDSPDRDFNIDLKRLQDKSLIYLNLFRGESLLGFQDLMKNATELHCINSAPAILADSITTNGKLFMHRYARPYTPYDNFKLRKKWTVFD